MRTGNQDLVLRFGILTVIMAVLVAAGSARAGEDQTREAMKGSIVYLEISSYGYDQIRPWKNTDIQKKSDVGCADRKSVV